MPQRVPARRRRGCLSSLAAEKMAIALGGVDVCPDGVGVRVGWVGAVGMLDGLMTPTVEIIDGDGLDGAGGALRCTMDDG